MAKAKEMTDRELLNKYSSMWLPLHAPKASRNDVCGCVTEELVSMLKESKQYDKLIEELQCRYKKDVLREDIENATVTKQLMSSSTDYKWDDVERAQKKLDKLWEELYALGENK